MPYRRSASLKIFAFIWIVALSVRLIHLWSIADAPFYDLLIGDALSYDTWAQQIAAGDWLGKGVFYQAPLYPYLLGVIYSIFGHSLTAVRIVQAVFGATSCLLLALATRRFMGRKAGVTAGMMLAVYPPAIFFDGIIQKSSLDGLLICALLWMVSILARRSSIKGWLIAGMICGLSALSRENALVLVAALLLWICLSCPHQAVACSSLLVGLVLILAPVAGRNYAVGGEFHLTTSQLGPNLYIGNHAGAEGIYQPLRFGHGDPQFESRDAADLASQALSKTLSPGEVSVYWVSKVANYITEQPGDWLKLMGRKCLLLISDMEIGDTDDQYTVADDSPLIAILGWFWRWGSALPLAVVGMIMTWSRRRLLCPVYLMAGAFGASVIAFYVMARYRFPFAPMVIMFAAAGAVHLISAIKRKRITGPLTASLVIAMVTAGICAYQPISPARFRAAVLNNMGSAMMATPQRYDEAHRYLEQAIELQPDYAKPHNHLGMLLKRQGDRAGALAHYQKAIELRPDYIDAHYNLAVLFSSSGHSKEALNRYQHVIELDPYHANAHNNMGSLLEQQAQYEQAGKFYQAALSIDENHREALNNLGMLAAFMGHTEKGIELLRKAVAIDPNYVDAHYNLGLALLIAEQPRQAADHFRTVLKLRPDDAQAAAKLKEALEK